MMVVFWIHQPGTEGKFILQKQKIIYLCLLELYIKNILDFKATLKLLQIIVY